MVKIYPMEMFLCLGPFPENIARPKQYFANSHEISDKEHET